MEAYAKYLDTLLQVTTSYVVKHEYLGVPSLEWQGFQTCFSEWIFWLIQGDFSSSVGAFFFFYWTCNLEVVVGLFRMMKRMLRLSVVAFGKGKKWIFSRLKLSNVVRQEWIVWLEQAASFCTSIHLNMHRVGKWYSFHFFLLSVLHLLTPVP